jgi:hypothetical protein
MMTSTACAETDWPALTGRQTPQYLLCDDGDQTEADKCLEFAARIKRPQMPWQADLLRGILALDTEGLFSHPLAVAVATRQSGKTLTAAEIRILYGLFARGERVILSAQRWSTAENTFKRIRRLIASRPSLDRRVTRWICSQGQASIELSNGASCAFITRSLDAGRGIDRIDLHVIDESYHVRPADQAGLSPTQLASKNPQTIYLSSAVNEDIHPFGHVLAGIRQRALDAIANGDTGTGLFYAEYAAPDPPEGCSDTERRALRESPETWRMASPSYGVIQTEAKMRKLLVELSPTDFEVECLGWGKFPAVGDTGARVIDADTWQALTDPAPEIVGPYPLVVAVDRSPVSQVWTIAGAQRTTNGTHIEIAWSAKSSATEAVNKLIDVVAECNPAAVLVSQGSPAAVLKGYLEAAGFEPTMVSATDYPLACEALLDGITDSRLTHSGQSILTESALSATRHPMTNGRFTWTGAPGAAPLCHLVGATLAFWGAATAKPPKRKPPAPMTAPSDDREQSIMTRPF